MPVQARAAGPPLGAPAAAPAAASGGGGQVRAGRGHAAAPRRRAGGSLRPPVQHRLSACVSAWPRAVSLRPGPRRGAPHVVDAAPISSLITFRLLAFLASQGRHGGLRATPRAPGRGAQGGHGARGARDDRPVGRHAGRPGRLPARARRAALRVLREELCQHRARPASRPAALLAEGTVGTA
jgi:hypothetical protein